LSKYARYLSRDTVPFKGAARDEDSVVRINDTDIFHGPHVELPEISFRDMAAFVNEAQRTIEARFEELEKEIYQSSARQVENLMRHSF
jgi:hypothetical protein